MDSPVPHILVVDDEESICWGFERLARQIGCTVEAVASAEQGLRAAADRRPDALILDVRLPGMDGLTAMQHFTDTCGRLPTIVITAHGDLSTAVEAVRQGAAEYLTKPFDLAVARKAIERAIQRSGVDQPRSTRPAPPSSEEALIGRTPPMQEVFKRIALAAASDACVHITGESGTGKELIARAIHKHGPRAEEPFVAVNVAALSPALAESELFGHIRGAFTGAESPRAGLLKSADRGTVFLDEVADMPPSIQVKLLRALEHGEFLPVGADRAETSDFRLLTATHQDLSLAAAEGRFRHDLYFRLNTFTIAAPALRDRRDDVPLLVEHFLQRLAKRGHAIPTISRDAMESLRSRPWSGNVRELRNAVEHALVLARNGTISVEHLPPDAKPPGDSTVGGSRLADAVRAWTEQRLAEEDSATSLYQRLLRDIEPPLLKTALQQTGGNCLAAAQILGLHRTTVRKKLGEHGLGADTPRS